MIDFAADVQTYLQDQNVVDDVTGWPSTRGALHDDVDQLVQIAEDAGLSPEIVASAGLGSAAFSRPSVLVLVRGKAGDRDAPRTKAEDIYDALVGLQDLAGTSGRYLMINARTSQFATITDEKQRYMFTMSYQAMAEA